MSAQKLDHFLDVGDPYTPPEGTAFTVIKNDKAKGDYLLGWEDKRFPGKKFSMWIAYEDCEKRFSTSNPNAKH